jgi:hypothetical protein
MRHHCGRKHEKPLTPETFREDVISWAGWSVFLFVVNWWTSPDFWWAFFPFFGWGMGIVVKAARLAGRQKGQDWEDLTNDIPVFPEKREEKPRWKSSDLV